MSEDQPPLGGGASPLSGPGALAVADLAEKIPQETGGQEQLSNSENLGEF